MNKPLQLCRLLLAALVFLSLSALSASQPNVVILLADDMGSGDLGCYGGPVKTPNIDSLAKQGSRFSTFYSGCAVCSPSRAVLMTGRQHIRAGVYNWIYDQTQNSHLLEREVTLAEILKKAGYETAHFGKWHLGLPMGDRDKPTPSNHGFDYWFATANNAEPSHHNPVNFVRNGSPVGEIQGYSCQIVADEAIQWLDTVRKGDAPFFLNVWFHEPHQKIAAPDALVDQQTGPAHTTGLAAAQENTARLYSATIANEDLAVGRLLRKLEEIAPREDTLIIYASDNGSYLQNRNSGLRGQKGVNWEGGLRVPGIFSWPGTIYEGKIVKTPGGLVDVLPTVCSLLDLPPPKDRHLDGADLAPLLMGKYKDFKRDQPFFWFLRRSKPIVALRDGKYSLVGYRDNPDLSANNMLDETWIPLMKNLGFIDYELYDLQQDPNQSTNIAAEKPEIAERLKKKLLEINAGVMAEGVDWHLGMQAGNE